MKRRTLFSLVLLAVAATPAFAQNAVPTEQPGLLTIFIEEIKPGMEAAHAANEAGWPAALADAGAPDTYLAFASMSGSSQVWYTTPYASHAAEGEAMARSAGNAALSSELERLWRADAEFLESTRQIRLVARPGLSHGDFPDLTKARFWDIITFRVRPGHEAQFAAAARTYGEVADRAGVTANYRVYQVTAGMPGGTYMLFGSVENYAAFDEVIANGNAINAAMTEEEQEVFQTFSREASQNTITNRFRLSAGMSYVDAATRAADPEFWGGN